MAGGMKTLQWLQVVIS